MEHPAADRVTELVLDDRALQMQLVAEEADADVSVGFLHVSVVGADINDAGYPASVACREGTFVQSNLLYCFRLEYREKTEHVVDIVDRDSVQKDKVFVRAAASDVKTGETFVSSLDSGHELDGFQYISFAEDYRNVLDMLQRHVQSADVCRLYSGLFLGDYDRFIKLRSRFENHIYRSIPAGAYPDSLFGIPDIRVGQFDLILSLIFLLLESKGIKTETVGYGTCLAPFVFVDYSGTDQSLSGRCIRDMSADGHPLLCRGNKRAHECEASYQNCFFH